MSSFVFPSRKSSEKPAVARSHRATGATALLLLFLASCTSPHRPEAISVRPMEGAGIGENARDLPSANVQAAYVTPATSPPAGPAMLGPAPETVPVPLPTVPGAEMVGNDEFCGTCHETYRQAFLRGVHGDLGCEQCHGPGSRHVQSRGLSAATILSLKASHLPNDAGRPLSPAERSEVCLQCHGECGDRPKAPCVSPPRWRKSAHAQRGLACSDCHMVHYLVPPGTPPVDRTTSNEAGGSEPRTASRERDSSASGSASPDARFMERVPPVSAPESLPALKSSERLPPTRGPGAPDRRSTSFFVGNPEFAELVDYRAPVDAGREQGARSGEQGAGSAEQTPAAPLSAQDRARRAKSSNHLGATSPGLCYRCHADKQRMEQVEHPHQMGVPFKFQCTSCHATVPQGYPHDVPNHPTQFNCTTCHDPHGSVTPESRRDLCLKCHSGGHLREWWGGPHDRARVACTDCHNPHPQQGPPMAVNQPATCYRCHTDKTELSTIAHPHAVPYASDGAKGFKCTTCHTPHGPLREEARTNLCLKCHNGTQTGQWHSSAHSLEGVACTDCHNPHPKPTSGSAPRMVEISSTHVTRPTRLPMTVEQPGVCYKCHLKIENRVNMPSRHPIREGKMLCSDCHDVHRRKGEAIDGDTVNMLCYKCHAEKRGPYVYEHPPVTENCCYCHEAHGTVEKNLLRQATSFLCLRCHTGHRRDPNNTVHWSTIDGNPAAQQALYSDCTQCHMEIHGTDYPSATRIGPIITDH